MQHAAEHGFHCPGCDVEEAAIQMCQGEMQVAFSGHVASTGSKHLTPRGAADAVARHILGRGEKSLFGAIVQHGPLVISIQQYRMARSNVGLIALGVAAPPCCSHSPLKHLEVNSVGRWLAVRPTYAAAFLSNLSAFILFPARRVLPKVFSRVASGAFGSRDSLGLASSTTCEQTSDCGAQVPVRNEIDAQTWSDQGLQNCDRRN